MKFRRRLRARLVILCASMAVLLTLGWISSHFSSGSRYLRIGERRWVVRSSNGAFSIQSFRPFTPMPAEAGDRIAPLTSVVSFFSPDSHYSTTYWGFGPLGGMRSTGYSEVLDQFPRRRSGPTVPDQSNSVDRPGRTTMWLFHASYWLPLVCFLLPPVLLILRRVARAKPRAGRCPNCNYDLRGNPNLCPECGTAASPHLVKLRGIATNSPDSTNANRPS